MATITKTQIQAINEKCKNGWKFDIQYFLWHNEKTLKKIIPLDAEHYLEFKLDYNSQNQIGLYINKFYHKIGDNFATSNGLGKNKILAETPANRKSVNKLIELTEQLTDEKLMQINSETDVIKSPIFVPSEAF